ncbi:MAG: M12 family metallopeptidase, partial [Bryobacteraceae bacterium]
MPRFLCPLVLLNCCCLQWALAQAAGLTLTISDPLPSAGRRIVFTTRPTVKLHGAVRLPAGLSGRTRVSWVIDERAGEGASVEATDVAETFRWATEPIALRPGPNRIRVRASGPLGETASASLIVSYAPAVPEPAPPEIRSAFYDGRPVTYEVRNGRAIYEGDIVLGTAEEMSAAKMPGRLARQRGRRQAATIAFSASLWPSSGGVAYVPYSLSANTQTSASAVNRITAAVASFNDTFSGVIQWVPSTGQTNRAIFDLTPADHSGGCESNVGMSGGVQTLGGSIDCAVSVLLHEMGHAAGLWHEQSRVDRDAYVNVIYSNIDKPLYYNFNQLHGNEVDLGFYDYGSIMHYFASAFSKFGQPPTLESVP